MPILPIADRRSAATYVLLGTLLVVSIAAYLASAHGGFQFDDFQNIVNNRALRAIGTPSQNWLALALSSDAGMLRRPLSMLSFGLNVAAFGMNPFAFKLVNLAIHLVNALLFYAIGHRIAGRLMPQSNASHAVDPNLIALIATGLWLLHPLNLSGVVYIVQRMNELATLFTLAGLLCYVDGRDRSLRGEPTLASALVGLCLFGLLAVFSKENGALIVGYALVIEALCFRFAAVTPLQQRVVKGFFWLSVALPLALFAFYLVSHPHWLAGRYAGRDFTLAQRLLTEARILCDYLLWIFVPNPQWMGLYHDDISTSTNLLHPATTVFAIAFLLALVVAAWKYRKRSPGLAFGVAWFLVGHSMESTILPLELVFEHRNYLPMAGLLLGAICVAASWLDGRLRARSIALGCAVLLLGLASLTAIRAHSWGDPLRLALDDVRHHPNSSRDLYAAGRAIIMDGGKRGDREKDEQTAAPYFARSAALDPTNLFAASASILIQASVGPVEPALIDNLSERLRTATSSVQANAFLDMLVSASERNLSLTAGDFSALVGSALSNKHFPNYVRAMILNNYGAYQFNMVHDNQSAVSLTLAAAAEDPKNPYFQINLAKIALALKQPDVAHDSLAKAKQLDAAGTYAQEIGGLETASIGQQ